MKFRKKPVVIDAEQFLPMENKIPSGIYSSEHADPRKHPFADWMINTLEGPLRVSDGDWIITGVKGEKYPCKPDIFAATYEPVE
jgi:hypothetical protein